MQFIFNLDPDPRSIPNFRQNPDPDPNQSQNSNPTGLCPLLLFCVLATCAVSPCIIKQHIYLIGELQSALTCLVLISLTRFLFRNEVQLTPLVADVFHDVINDDAEQKNCINSPQSSVQPHLQQDYCSEYSCLSRFLFNKLLDITSKGTFILRLTMVGLSGHSCLLILLAIIAVSYSRPNSSLRSFHRQTRAVC